VKTLHDQFVIYYMKMMNGSILNKKKQNGDGKDHPCVNWSLAHNGHSEFPWFILFLLFINLNLYWGQSAQRSPHPLNEAQKDSLTPFIMAIIKTNITNFKFLVEKMHCNSLWGVTINCLGEWVNEHLHWLMYIVLTHC